MLVKVHLCQESCSSPPPMLSIPLRKVTNSRSYWKKDGIEFNFIKFNKCIYLLFRKVVCWLLNHMKSTVKWWYLCVFINALAEIRFRCSVWFSKRIVIYHLRSKVQMGQRSWLFFRANEVVVNSGNLLNEYTAPSTDSRGGQMSVEAHISCHPIWPIERRKDHCSFKVKFISIISFTTQINTPACIFNTDSVWFCGTELYKHTSELSEHRKKGNCICIGFSQHKIQTMWNQ